MYTVLIVGFGSIGKRHLENIMANYNDVKIIVCTKRTDLKELERFGVIIVNSLSEAILYKPDVGFITNETRYHVKIAISLAKNGIDLFIEKPLSNSIYDINHLRKIIRNKKLITQIGCNMRFHPCIAKMKEILDEGKLGRVISVNVESSSFLPDWHPYEDYRLGYAARRDLGGGISLTCIHEIDFLCWFFGDVKKIFSVTGKYSDLEVTTDDLSVMTLIFKNNIIGEVHLDYVQRPDFKSCKIIGTKGTMYWDSSTNEVKIFYQNKKQWKSILKLNNFQRNSMYVKELEHFFRHIKKRAKTINDIDDGIKTLKIVLSAQKSSALGKMLSI
jgi:predicted dehydrogenase